MTIDTILNSKEIHILFDGCPTCSPEASKYLDECRVQARYAHRQLHVVQSGSQTAMMMRTIAKNQGRTVEYPMILIDGIIHYNPQDITEETEK